MCGIVLNVEFITIEREHIMDIKKNALENDSRKTILEPLKNDLMIQLLV